MNKVIKKDDIEKYNWMKEWADISSEKVITIGDWTLISGLGFFKGLIINQAKIPSADPGDINLNLTYDEWIKLE